MRYMNSKIRQIAEQATRHCIEQAKNDAWLYEDKVAELIVKRCIEICEGEIKFCKESEKLSWSSGEVAYCRNRISAYETIINRINYEFKD